MKLKSQQLQQTLAQGLSPIYLISGDESLLAQEAADTIRSEAKKQGFLSRELFHVEGASSIWQDIQLEANSMSLFSDQKVIEIRCKSNKIGDVGSKAIQALLEAPNPDIILLISMPKLEAAQQKSKWVKLIEETGHHLPVWPITREELPRWLEARMRSVGLKADPDAIAWLADNVEGNLLAAKQEIDKLQLWSDGELLTLEKMNELIHNSSRYTVFNFIDRCLAGDTESAFRTLRGLKAEGTDATIVLWALSKECRLMLELCKGREQGQNPDNLMQSLRVFKSKQGLVRRCLQRSNSRKIEALLRQARQIDRSIKGLSQQDVWLGLEKMSLRFAQ